MVGLLLGAKVDPNRKEGGFSPLFASVENGDVDVARLLLTAKADIITARKKRGGTRPLIWDCARKGNSHMIKELCLAKCDPNLPRESPTAPTPLSTASKQNHQDVVKALLACKAIPQEEEE